MFNHVMLNIEALGQGSNGGGLHNGLLDTLYQIRYVSEIYKRILIVPDNVIS